MAALVDAPTLFEPHVEVVYKRGARRGHIIRHQCQNIITSLCGRRIHADDASCVSPVPYCLTCKSIRSTQ